MILRLLLYLLPFTFVRTENNPECATRVDVLDGKDLVEGVARFLTERVIALSSLHCALSCYNKNCDVAYYHKDTRECRFTPDSSSETVKLPCNDVIAEEHKEGIEILDKVKRFCMRCRGFTVTENRRKFSEGNSQVKIQSNTVETKPVPVTVVHSSKPRIRVFMPSTVNVPIPPRPKVSAKPLHHTSRKVSTLPLRVITNRHKSFLTLDIQRVDGSSDKRSRFQHVPGRLVRPALNTTQRPTRTKSLRLKKLRRRKQGYSFRKDAYKIAVLPPKPTRFYAEAATNGSIRFLRKKRRGWGNA
ncbi:unnamed protein product [Cylicocyclus nassatus]|uniref:PAN domain protein n=1 Tax=Cylicocyclus nassatus TaxID=53992 RepID=A0AA36HA83_CYLNA|nr:unnamed protein product [Cylicocyclus nassatus]